MTAPLGSDTARVRLTMVLVVVACLFASLFARLWSLQVINAPKAQAVAENNGIRAIYTPAPRGQILDRNGVVLVGNRLSEVIEVDRQSAIANPSMVVRLAALLGMTVSQLDAVVANKVYSPYAPVPVLPDASASEILYVQEHQDLFTGVTATTEAVRAYSAAGKAAANIVGYAGQIGSAQYQQLKSKGYQGGDQIGLAGVEASYEAMLRGQPGVERVQVNSKGNVLSVVTSTSPVRGADLRLSIDATVQMAAANAVAQGLATAQHSFDRVTGRDFAAPAGAAVVEDPRDGSLLALATYPVYNPEDFLGGISQSKYAAYQAPAANQPLVDRTIQGQYAPGSTFKLVTATAALQAGLITPSSTYTDQGHIKIGPQQFHNDNFEVLGTINLTGALIRSSDIFFNQLGAEFWNGYVNGRRFGPTALQDVAKRYGFDSTSQVALPHEAPGKIPTPASVKSDFAQHPKDFLTGDWFTGDSAQVAVGQFEVLVTPLQLANAYSTFANGGTRWQPRITLDAEEPGGRVLVAYAPVKKETVVLPDPDRQAMLAGFSGVVNNPLGTAYGVFANTPLAAKDIAGKTGTAQVSPPKQNTSLFTSFAPSVNPTFEVTAVLEQAGYGASIAGPVVRQIYDVLYGLPPQPVVQTAVSGAQT
ncbi:MAG: penicillin-binding protein 2 [Acidimicrobiales bacterium]